MGGTLAGSAARVAGGIGIVACAAVVAFAVGGGGVFGGLGGLFGSRGSSLQVAGAASPAADIVAAPDAAQRARELHHGSPPGRLPLRLPGRGQHRPRMAPRRVIAAPSPGTGAPAPSLPTPPPAPPSPSPGSGQVVATVRDTGKQLTGQAPPQLQPVTQPVNDALDQLVRTCQGLPVCP